MIVCILKEFATINFFKDGVNHVQNLILVYNFIFKIDIYILMTKYFHINFKLYKMTVFLILFLNYIKRIYS